MGGEPTIELPADVLSLELQAVLERLYDRHKRDVYKIALRYAGRRVDWAEDVTHDVFIALARNLTALDAHDDLMGWLYRATTRRCLNRLEMERFRALAPVRWLSDLLLPQPAQPDAIAFAKDEIGHALECLAALPPKERIAFAMYRIDQRPIREIRRDPRSHERVRLQADRPRRSAPQGGAAMNRVVELAEQLRSAERHQYGRPFSAEADARIRASLLRSSLPRRNLLRGTAGAVALAMLLLSVRALSNGAVSRVNASQDIGDAALVEAGITASVDWESRTDGPRELP